MSEFREMREYMLARRDELQQRLDAIKRDLSTELDSDFAEQAVEQENREVLQQLGSDAEQEIAKINRALIRMDEGEYGYCTDCGEAINPERLKARPYSTRCLPCAEAAESVKPR